MGEVNNTTPFELIYDAFFTRVTDDMYYEMSELDTFRDLQDILIVSLPRFEFPRFDLFDYELGYKQEFGTYCGVDSDYNEVPATVWVGGSFNCKLTIEEINIIAVAMMVEWFERQLATTELTKEKYTGADFKMTSQANHMAKLKVEVDERKNECLHLQRLYKRRIRDEKGKMRSSLSDIMGNAPGWKE